MVAVSQPRRPESIEPEPAIPPLGTASTAEVAECTCPDFCERDHDID